MGKLKPKLSRKPKLKTTLRKIFKNKRIKDASFSKKRLILFVCVFAVVGTWLILSTLADGDSTPPTVSITAPAASSTKVAGTLLSATAADDTAVAGVQFKVDGVNYGTEVTSSPYTHTLDTFTLSNGTHSITALARDASSNQTTSSAVSITVNNNLPALQPDVITSNPWTCSGTVNINRVIISNLPANSDGVYLSTKGDTCKGRIGYLEINDVPQDGVKIRPGAQDIVIESGKIRCGTSNGIVHQDGVQAQDGTNVSFLKFDSQCTTNLGESAFFGSARTGQEVTDVTCDGCMLSHFGSSYSLTIGNCTTRFGARNSILYKSKNGWVSIPDAGINNHCGIVAIDPVNENNQQLTCPNPLVICNSIDFSGGAPPDTTAPTVSISTPSNGATISGSVTVSGNASDDTGVAGVQFKLDGANLQSEDSSSPYSLTWDTTTSTNGSHTLTAVARDAAGNMTTATSINVTVNNITPPPPDTTAPTLSITEPANGTTVLGSSVAVSATAADNIGVVGVQFKLDGSNLGSEDTNTPYSTAWNTTTATDGSHTLTAVARDAAGNTTTSSIVTTTVDNTAPAVSITSPGNLAIVHGSSSSITASASDSIGVTSVDFELDGDVIASDSSSPYSTTWSTTDFNDGLHILTVLAQDEAGNTGTSSSIIIIIDNLAPTTPANFQSTATSTSSVSLSWTASTDDGTGVTGYNIYRNGSFLTSTTLTSYTDSDLAPNTSYSYKVSAVDGLNNESSQSSNLNAKTASTAGSSSTSSASHVGNGDSNNDGNIDILDLSLLLSHYGTHSAIGDQNGDGIVDIIDLSILLSNYGK